MATFSNTETKKIIAYAMATTPSPSDEEIIAWVCDNPIAFTKAFGGRGIIGNVLNTKNAIIELLTEKADMIKNLKHEVSVCDEDEDGDGWIVNTSGHISIHLNGATYWDTEMKCRKSLGGTGPRLQITRRGGCKCGDGK
ncbi:hypothetical protein HBI81_249530 [Parastagonospora nodorum]|nr:hypothetical protein HBI73_237460 [Parastagonospora nodorum]KAH5621115.1 hypothetical protein HBI23_240800 [Parastagonospora nodorum]KAH5706572.1 hypothetical protein HBI18_252850 [Parastagonospora nodorum]KAH6510918.1 hypothetical protein HBI81_249530 [Parastagonospora nodorum]